MFNFPKNSSQKSLISLALISLSISSLGIDSTSLAASHTIQKIAQKMSLLPNNIQVGYQHFFNVVPAEEMVREMTFALFPQVG
ncbi:MAG: hypothetical protein HC903_08825 [Methylacidiphilales bacterium]|nr:hypothetical protein [Candidatus Methylacidiphilales bacterium]